MKKLTNALLIPVIIAIILSGCTATNASTQTAASPSVSYQTFYDDLAPYGTWIDYPGYGHVWHPSVAGNFRPYLTNGSWDYSTAGWMWMSNYNWGWAPFHYGRWLYDDLYGWLWIPGYEWSPAWVTWGMVDDFYSWAPLLPEVNVGAGFAMWRPAGFYWNICRRDHIYDKDINNVVEKREVINNYVNRISVINNFGTTNLHNQYYAKGPDVNEVQKFTGRKIAPASLREIKDNSIARHEGAEIKVYKPAVTHPQPRDFKQVDNASVKPLITDEDNIHTNREQQMENINRLPARRAPGSAFERNAGARGRSRQR